MVMIASVVSWLLLKTNHHNCADVYPNIYRSERQLEALIASAQLGNADAALEISNHYRYCLHDEVKAKHWLNISRRLSGLPEF